MRRAPETPFSSWMPGTYPSWSARFQRLCGVESLWLGGRSGRITFETTLLERQCRLPRKRPFSFVMLRFGTLTFDGEDGSSIAFPELSTTCVRCGGEGKLGPGHEGRVEPGEGRARAFQAVGLGLRQVTSFTQPELCELFLTPWAQLISDVVLSRYLRRGLQITKLCHWDSFEMHKS